MVCNCSCIIWQSNERERERMIDRELEIQTTTKFRAMQFRRRLCDRAVVVAADNMLLMH